MAATITMPRLSPTMTEGTLARWLVRAGDTVQPGDVVAEIETDKATMEVEAVEGGTVGRILIAEGTEGVPVDTDILLLVDDGEDADALAGALASAPSAAGPAPGGPAAEEIPVAARPVAPRVAVAAPEPEEAAGVETVEITVREALRDAMAEEMRRDDKVFLMGEEVAEYQGAYKISQGLLEEFGERRVRDTPITEHGFAGLGVGAAFGGLKPIVEFMTFNFAMQAIDHIVNSAAKTLYVGGQMGCPIVFRGPNGAAARVAAQHSQCYASWYAHLPGLKVVAPFSAADSKGLLKSAIRDPNPVVFLENEILYGHSGPVPAEGDVTVPIGRARILRPGTGVTIVAFSRMCALALEAAETLAAEGIEAEVIDLRTLRPLDRETVAASIRRTNRIVAVEEGWPVAGIASEIAAIAMEDAFDWLDAPVARVTGVDVPMPYAANLEELALPSASGIVEAAKAVCYA